MIPTIADRVREVIARSETTQSGFAQRIDLDPSKLSKSLNGSRRFSSLELAMVAEAGRTTVDWLLTGRASRTGLLAARTAAVDDVRLDEATMSQLEGISERWEALDALHVLQPETFEYVATTAEDSLADAASAASAVLERLGGVEASFESTAVLFGLVETRLGIDVTVVDLPDRLDGLSFVLESHGLIVLQRTARASRQRFTLGHELGHVVFQDDAGEVRRDALVKSDSAVERRANAFAAEFCMPAEVLRQESAEHGDLLDLAWRLHVSPDALAWRLFNLGLIDDVERTTLSATSAHGAALAGGHGVEWVDRMRASQAPRAPQRLVVASLAAYESGLTTLDAAADLLGVPVDDLREDRPFTEDVALV